MDRQDAEMYITEYLEPVYRIVVHEQEFHIYTSDSTMENFCE